MANMRQIAKQAGVGIATVSRYINNTGYVSEEVKAKIEKVIEEVHYRPNELARAIFKRNSKIIGLLVPNISNPYFNEMALIIEEYASNLGFSIFLCNTNDDPKKERAYINVLQGHRVAGIITVRSQCKEEYTSQDIPVVSFESHISEKVITVATDNYTGGKIAFEHLYESGCRKFVHVKGPDFSEAINARSLGFIESAREKNLSIDIIKFETDFQRKMLEANIKILEDIEKFDGIFVFNDIAAATVIRYFQQKNIQIPEQVQVIGFDNSYIGEFLYPSLTTIEQSVSEVGKTMVKVLIKMIKGEAIKQRNIMIQPKLIKRETTVGINV
ncbi:LacI family transcriptional regulator [Bacillus canaveralius]|uniref:LacI family transcriptional regulator n=1 Tax=Bacillus canaveralius TaxID=1403243 RepID=A0A2N5GI34_9BACI|nr:LacI family DNA-binding transcriptional regulator [Bacillus canaveralius]PLR80546.1 LacI family transcriptional regulator [Bacillus canaveralius]PLR92494.1 LacI family transcriptional regulator [Bacillus canaveralius]